MRVAWIDQVQLGALLLTAFAYSAGYSLLGLVTLLCLALVETVARHQIPWRRTSGDPLLVVFLFVLLASGWLSEFRPLALASAGLAGLTVYLAFVPSYRLIQRDARYLHPIIVAWALGGSVAAAWALALHYQSGKPAYTPALGQNAVGTTLMLALIFALGLFLFTRSGWRYLFLGTLVPLAAGLAFSYTRGAWLGAVAGSALALVLTGRRVALRALLPLLVALSIGMTFVLAQGEMAGLVSRGRSIIDVSANQVRLHLARGALRIIRDHPLTGTGLNTFSLVYPSYRPANPNAPATEPFAPNIFLNFWAETGFPGFLALLAIVGWTIRNCIRAHAHFSRSPSRPLVASTIGAYAGAMTHQLFDGTLLSVHLGIGLWILVSALAALARPKAV